MKQTTVACADGEKQGGGSKNGKASCEILDSSDASGAYVLDDPRFSANQTALLRLFRSDFFNEWLAVLYLHRYSDPEHAGIQDYLCERLGSFQLDAVLDFLPQICHILVTNPHIWCLERLILRLASTSSHFAAQALWFMQCYCADLAGYPSAPAYNLCHDIVRSLFHIFDFPAAPSHHVPQHTATDMSPASPPEQQNEQEEEETHGESNNLSKSNDNNNNSQSSPALSNRKDAVAVPQSAVATATSRRNRHARSASHSILSSTRTSSSSTRSLHLPNHSAAHLTPHQQEQIHFQQRSPPPPQRSALLPNNTQDLVSSKAARVSLEELHGGKAFSFTSFLKRLVATDTSSGSSSAVPSRSSSANNSPSLKPTGNRTGFDQNAMRVANVSTHAACVARNEYIQTICGQNNSALSFEPSQLEEVLARNPRVIMRHHFHALTKLFATFSCISDRLLSLPSVARNASLAAEITLLNHNFPARVCLPLWCTPAPGDPCTHHVLRICPSDAIVLDSATRVPYIVFIEVLNRDTSSEVGQQDDPFSAHPSSAVDRNSFFTSGAQDLHRLSLERNFRNSGGKTEFLKSEAQKQNEDKGKENVKQGTTSTSDSRQQSAANMINVLQRRVSMDRAGGHDGIMSSKQSNKAPSSEQIPEATSTLEQQHQKVADPEFNEREFVERMRTAAIMLAQLAQQEEQQTELIVPATNGSANATSSHNNLTSNGNNNSSSSSNNSNSGGGGGGGFVSFWRRKKVPPPRSSEMIRDRILKEMVSLEECRMRALSTRGLNTASIPGGPMHSRSGSANGSSQDNLKNDSSSSSNDNISEAVQENSAGDQVTAGAAASPSWLESWDRKVERFRSASPYGGRSGWGIKSIILKADADLRQEQFAFQLVRVMRRIWAEAGVGCWVYPFRVMVTGPSGGLIETIKNTVSIHTLKKTTASASVSISSTQKSSESDAKVPSSEDQTAIASNAVEADAAGGVGMSLREYFLRRFGPANSESFIAAQANFAASLAGYSILTWVLNVKDRHNGNIMLDITTGHLVHIDFGFMLSNSPGGRFAFETAPFKLPYEYIDVLDGLGSRAFQEFRSLVIQGFQVLRREHEQLVGLVEIMERGSPLPCFTYTSLPTTSDNTAAQVNQAHQQQQAGTTPSPNASFSDSFWLDALDASSPAQHQQQMSTGVNTSSTTGSTTTLSVDAATYAKQYPVAAGLRERLMFGEIEATVDKLIHRSLGSVFTRLYDSFQYYSQGVYS